MRKELFSTALGMAASLATLGVCIAAAPASAQQADVRVMALGGPTLAPPGYLDFCARTPDQCGIAAPIDPDGRPVSPASLRTALYNRFFWSIAFGETSSAPAAGDAPVTRDRAAPAGRYDWSAIFGAPVAPAPPAMVAPASGLVRLAWTSSSPPASGASDGAASQPPVEDTAATSPPPAATAEVAKTLQSDPDEPAYARGPGDAPPSTVAAATEAPMTDAGDAGPDQPAYAVARSVSPAIDPGQGGAPLQATPALMAELDQVNLYVNRAIRYVPDLTLYGNEDYWHLSLGPGGPAAGDCKDYVLEKRRALIAAGVPAGDLSIAIVDTSWGETHAVLLVNTDRGELVLDSLSSWIQPWWKVNYHWIKRQAHGEPLNWVALS